MSTAKPWNYKSVVTACLRCNGHGVIPANRRATINDPYPQDDCECGLGEHGPTCEVCGFNQIVRGFDCLACDTVWTLNAAELKALNVKVINEAMAVAVAKARGEVPAPTLGELAKGLVKSAGYVNTDTWTGSATHLSEAAYLDALEALNKALLAAVDGNAVALKMLGVVL